MGTPDEAETGSAKIRAFVRERPWLSVAAGAALGGVLGGLATSRLARLAFVATAGFVAHELWHREGGLDLDAIFGEAAAGAEGADRAR
jgi:hypothetical protein